MEWKVTLALEEYKRLDEWNNNYLSLRTELETKLTMLGFEEWMFNVFNRDDDMSAYTLSWTCYSRDEAIKKVSDRYKEKQEEYKNKEEELYNEQFKLEKDIRDLEDTKKDLEDTKKDLEGEIELLKNQDCKYFSWFTTWLISAGIFTFLAMWGIHFIIWFYNLIF